MKFFDKISKTTGGIVSGINKKGSSVLHSKQLASVLKAGKSATVYGAGAAKRFADSGLKVVDALGNTASGIGSIFSGNSPLLYLALGATALLLVIPFAKK